MTKIFKFLSNTSLDVVIGAIICSNAFWNLSNVPKQYKSILLVLLGITTFIIYIFDRLLDINNSTNELSDRHLFIKKYYFNFQLILIALSFIALTLCFIIPTKLVLVGIVILTGAGLYLTFVNRLDKKNHILKYKEIYTAILYSFGVLCGPFTVLSSINLSYWLIAFLFSLVVFQEILWNSVFELRTIPNFDNLASKIGLKKSRRVINICSGIIVFLTLQLFNSDFEMPTRLAYVICLISLLLSLTTALPERLITNKRYLLFGELLFWLPIILIFGL